MYHVLVLFDEVLAEEEEHVTTHLPPNIMYRLY